MREKDLDRAFGNTPPAFTGRIHQTLAQLEDKPRRIPRLRAALIVAAVLALLCGIAYAVIMQGQAWYYNNRFTAYQEHEPQKHQAIMDNLQIVTRQEQTEGTPVRVTVQDAAWVPQEKLLTVSLRAVETDPQTQELHPMWNLDPDGSYVGDDAEALGLRPVMALKSSVSTIKVFDDGTSVSYGRTFRTEGRTRVGVLPIGYADGFFRGLSGRMRVVTEQGKAPLLGRICMDMCMVDLTALPDVHVGDTVEIFGQRQRVDDLAAILGTIPYELTCAVSKRVPRVYLSGGQEIARELRIME